LGLTGKGLYSRKNTSGTKIKIAFEEILQEGGKRSYPTLRGNRGESKTCHPYSSILNLIGKAFIGKRMTMGKTEKEK